MTTKVLVDAWQLTGASRYRGIGSYLRPVLAGLGTRPELAVQALTLEPDSIPPGVVPRRIRRVAPSRWLRREHELLLPLSLYRHRCDVMFSPAQDPPRRSPVPFVQTLLDATALVIPSPELRADRERMERLAPHYRKATRFVAISSYTADSCAEHLGIDRDRIDVALLGIDAQFTPAPRPPDERDPYILLVGEYGPHKGYGEAFEVIAGLAKEGLPHRLKVAGRVAPWKEAAVRARVDAAPLPDRIDILGFVDDLAALYQGAAALIMTSRHEGFGFPLVEAMACGTPVVAFANSSVTEVVGDGGALVSDGDVEAMVDVLVPLLTDPAARAAAARRGLARAETFSWDRCVDVHVETLLRAAAR